MTMSCLKKNVAENYGTDGEKTNRLGLDEFSEIMKIKFRNLKHRAPLCQQKVSRGCGV